jgi:hypothetical protein
VTEVTLDNLQPEQKIDLMINFMSSVYDQGLRGDQIGSLMSGVKQSMVLRGYSVGFFESERYRQAVKACRLTNEDQKKKAMFQIENSQLPIHMEMIDYMKEASWNHVDWTKKGEVGEARAYLCCALAFDTGRRIGQFTHKDGKTAEDHCIRNVHVHYKCGEVNLKGGIALKRHLEESHLGIEAITAVDLYFLTQKEGGCGRGKPCVPASVMRRTQDESQLLDQLATWVLFNLNDDDEELFTLNWRGGTKKLIQKEMTAYIKKIACAMDLDPKRYGNHSLRRGYATAAHQECIESTLRTYNNRAGWVPTSRMAITHYSQAGSQGIHAFNGTSSVILGGTMAVSVGTIGTPRKRRSADLSGPQPPL